LNFISCVSLTNSLLIQMDGKKGQGIILKKAMEVS
jgi:hypothetical protein